MEQLTQCHITAVGKRRDGGNRYWCLEHRADATAKYGRRSRQCRYAHIPPIKPNDIIKINISDYKGGIALWGTVSPIYDTTRLPIDHGIHVHARKLVNGEKDIDATYRAVSLVSKKNGAPQQSIMISELDAVYYMVTSIFGYPMKYVECTFCKFPHLDKDWFSVHPHRRHLCAGCGQLFRDTDTAIGNPAIKVQEIFTDNARTAKPAKQSIEIRQADFPGGIRIWGSNPAILWTASRSEDEGIHLHAFGKDSNEPLKDNTFSSLTIDGIKLDPAMVRVLMAQNALPHISGRVINIICPKCNNSHFDTGELAFTPHEEHTCTNCGFLFRNKGRLRKTIGNPMIDILTQLAKHAHCTPQKHKINLIPETL